MSTSISQLEDALLTLRTTTSHALATSQSLSRRTRHLSTLTTPASETSSSLTQASTNLTSTVAMLRDAREKFDTVVDCEPSIERLYRGAMELIDSQKRTDHPINTYNVPNGGASLVDGGGRRNFYDDDTMTLATLNGTSIGLTEQDVYAAADSLEIIRDAHAYFLQRPKWKSSKSALTGLERVHELGVDGMSGLIHCHLTNAGPAIRMKRGWAMLRNGNGDDASTIATNTTFGTRQVGGIGNPRAQETARDTRERLSAALQNRDLMKSVGEYEESLPLDTRIVRELRAIFECLGGHGSFLSVSTKAKSEEIMKNISQFQVAAGKVGRTEKIGSGHYTKLTMKNFASGYPHLDAYSKARRTVAYQSMQLYYKTLRAERKKEWDKRASSGGDMAQVESGELDSSARDAVRCLEHAMVIVAGEKSIYRCVVSPTSSHTHDSSKIPLEYKYALVAAYSDVCGVVVDRVLDIIELFFVKDAALRNQVSKSSSANNESSSGLDGVSTADGSAVTDVPSVRFAASAAAAGLRILDAVRMLGPSLAKLCEMASDKLKLNSGISSAGSTMSKEGSTSLASNLCIAIHRMTVKNAGKALENLALAAKQDPLDGEKYRPKDGRVAAISSDVVRAIRLVSPFVNAYKSVTKRRQLPWDPKIGAAAGEMDYFVRFLVMTLLKNLEQKKLRYTKDPDPVAEAKSHVFFINNTFYLLQQLGPNSITDHAAPILRNNQDELLEGDDYKIHGEWFTSHVDKLFEKAKKDYLESWNTMNKHLTAVAQNELSYSNAEQNLLTLESGRLLKARFSGFNDEFEKTYNLHKGLTIIDTKLRKKLVEDVKKVFLPKYRDFYNVYSKYQFSKKKMEDYLKYPPPKVEAMITDMFSSY